MPPRLLGVRLRADLDAALATEIRRLDLLVARVSQVLYAGAIVAGLAVALGASRGLGLSIASVSAAYLVSKVFLVRVLLHGSLDRASRFVTSIVDSTVPWVFALGLALTQGPAYALSSWVPPLLFCAVLVGGVVRLRPLVPLLTGTTSGVIFLLLYFLVLRARLSPDDAAHIVYQPDLQVTRAAVLVLGGILGALVTDGMRGVVARAERVVRQRDLFGKYRLVRGIAEGGMGEVLEALYCPEGGFERRVAIKRIHREMGRTQKVVDAFRAEAELSARLAHPNLVQVFDFGKVEDAYFLAMEYVDGLTLSALVARSAAARRPLGPDVVGFIGREVLAGLGYAHAGARGSDGRPLRVVHRDLCPQNILVSRNGEVKVTDFGVARALRDEAAAETRVVRGHLAYLAPEQVELRPVDERTDLYAVGVILWELLVGWQLFPPTEPEAQQAIVAHLPVPVTRYRRDIDPGWDAFLARAIAREPAKRFASAREMADALGDLAGARSDLGAERTAELVEAFSCAAAGYPRG